LDVAVRVAIVATLVAAGAYAQTNTGQARIGALLVAAGLFASLWLLNGAANPTLFTIGLLLGGAAPTVFAYLMLAYPSGRLQSSGQRRLLVGAGGSMFVLWTFMVLTSRQPALTTPLLECGPHCPANTLFIGSSGSVALSVAGAGVVLSWIALACGTTVLLFARIHSGAEPARRSFIPVEVTAVAGAAALIAFFSARLVESNATGALGAAYVETALLVPVTILAGLFVERLSMGRALATFVTRLSEHPGAAPEALLAGALQDPSVKIAYYRPRTGTHVDDDGRQVPVPEADEHRAVVQVERGGAPIALVSYDAALSDQAAFVEAAGAVALMHAEASQLEADLTESNLELAASRLRLVGAADAERQRMERDLHDGVQQHVVGLRLRLDLASEAIREDPARGERMIAAIGVQIDDLLAELRSLAAGIYPSVLTERGLKDSLESVVRNVPRPLSLHTFGLGRYPQDIEVAVYFCCVEAIQNAVKHGGPETSAKIRVWHIGDALAFEVRDAGVGFEPQRITCGKGLANMRDRIEAVAGRLLVGSEPGRGTWVRGRVPIPSAGSSQR
jgi:signal transduction histidine kinase